MFDIPWTFRLFQVIVYFPFPFAVLLELSRGAGPVGKWRIVGVQSPFLLREALSRHIGLLLRLVRRRLRHAGSHVRHRLATWLLRHKPGRKECSLWIYSELYEYSREQPTIHLSKPQRHDVEVLRDVA